MISQTMRYGENPVAMICPHCHEQTITKISHECSTISHMLALGCCMVGLWFGCCLIPYCITSIKDVKHNCSKCGTFLGIKRNGCLST